MSPYFTFDVMQLANNNLKKQLP